MNTGTARKAQFELETKVCNICGELHIVPDEGATTPFICYGCLKELLKPSVDRWFNNATSEQEETEEASIDDAVKTESDEKDGDALTEAGLDYEGDTGPDTYSIPDPPAYLMKRETEEEIAEEERRWAERYGKRQREARNVEPSSVVYRTAWSPLSSETIMRETPERLREYVRQHKLTKARYRIEMRRRAQTEFYLDCPSPDIEHATPCF